MFERFLSKESMDKLINSIANKVAEKTTQSMAANLQRISTSSEEEKRLGIEKKRLEVSLLKMEKDKKDLEETQKKNEQHIEKTENNKISIKDKIKDIWYKLTYTFRLKVDEKDFKTLLLVHKEKTSPQAIQGMWQAYGQMRAGRITGRFALLTTGVAGTALWLYQKSLSDQKKEIERQKIELKQRYDDVDKRQYTIEQDEQRILSISSSHEMIQSALQEADKIVKKLCGGDEKCWKEYESAKNAAQDAAKKKFKGYLDELYSRSRHILFSQDENGGENMPQEINNGEKWDNHFKNSAR